MMFSNMEALRHLNGVLFSNIEVSRSLKSVLFSNMEVSRGLNGVMFENMGCFLTPSPLRGTSPSQGKSADRRIDQGAPGPGIEMPG